ncbi:MAG: LysM peptidoglycan-binding domain-containing protein [Dehalococcoidia bacterium]|nr:LysM peptidoglycan-binding domain-containing protein [Dehalococcoidia bacterium]
MLRRPVTIDRRSFLRGAVSVGLAAAAVPRGVLAALDPSTSLSTSTARPAYAGAGLPTHLAWVWQFNQDGPRAEVRDVLAAHGLGIVIKTHDGPDWMSRYDKSADGITGSRKVEELANFFENAGVPFHAWAVMHGSNPVREAEMAADVLSAGARSLSMDLEPHPGFWRGTPTAAAEFGSALRWRAPSASLITSIDPRPWTIERIPLDQFAAFSDALAPQVYWHVFATPSNVAKYVTAGFDPGPAGMTAKFTMDTAMSSLARFNLPVTPVGDGTAPAMADWREFIDSSFTHDGVESIGVWRYGVAAPALWEMLRDLPPRVSSYVVESGDTLGSIARRMGTDVQSLVEVNGLANANFLSIGQQLKLPRGTHAPASAPVAAASSAGGGGSGRTYTIETGDSLWSLARKWNTTSDAIASLNGIADASKIRIGQRLIVP